MISGLCDAGRKTGAGDSDGRCSCDVDDCSKTDGSGTDGSICICGYASCDLRVDSVGKGNGNGGVLLRLNTSMKINSILSSFAITF